MRTGRICLGHVYASPSSFASPSIHKYRPALRTAMALLVGIASCFWGSSSAFATVTAVSVQAPYLTGNPSALSSPVHFQATAESDLEITGYVVYIDAEIAFQNYLPVLDAWVVVAPGAHSFYVKVWDSSGSLLSTETYQINVSGFSPPTPPIRAARVNGIADNSAAWVVDNNPGVGGNCNDGSIGTFQSSSDPNTNNSPGYPASGQLFMVTSKCRYDDSLFYAKDTKSPYPYASDTNFLWDFWFYIPATSLSGSIQALEFDFFQAVQLSDGVHEFMFGSQCNYATNQWQLWLPNNNGLTWVNTGLSPCQFSSGGWHHSTYFLQRVTPDGYQKIPASFDPASDTNTSLRFGTLTIDGNTMYLGFLSNSTIPSPKWSPTLGVQHQLDTAQSGVTIEEYDDKESVIAW
jgi:hypothetical protein